MREPQQDVPQVSLSPKHGGELSMKRTRSIAADLQVATYW